jgi:acetaldehyde dehydrogenase (acetylating)
MEAPTFKAGSIQRFCILDRYKTGMMVHCGVVHRMEGVQRASFLRNQTAQEAVERLHKKPVSHNLKIVTTSTTATHDRTSGPGVLDPSASGSGSGVHSRRAAR